MTLKQRGHELSVIKPWVDEAHPRIRALRDCGIPVADLNRVGSRAWDVANALLPARVQFEMRRRHVIRLLAALAHIRPDLAVISQGFNFDGVGLTKACRIAGVPYVLISQKASDLIWPDDAIRPYIRRAFLESEQAIFVSEHNRRLTEEQAAVTLPQASVLRNPFLAGSKGPLPWPVGPFRLACVARLDIVEKGQDILLRTLALERWRQSAPAVSLFGEGFNRQGLQGLANRLGLSNVTFHGHVDDVEGIWRSHHALVLPSRSEGLPLVLVEAMMCGRPAIVSDVGGNREVVLDGETGFLASGPTVPALDAALTRAWDARSDLERIGANAADFVRGIVEPNPAATLADRLLDITA
jgi:glycosyltransferase involved in cell wall biosynthesis